MTDPSVVSANFQKLLDENSVPVRVKHYEEVADHQQYDDALQLQQTGVAVWVSGCIQPIKNVKGSYDAVLLEQGKIKTTDKKIYVPNVATNGTIKVGIGSPVTTEHSVIPDGMEAWEISGSVIYKKLYLRELVAGSLIGEFP